MTLERVIRRTPDQSLALTEQMVEEHKNRERKMWEGRVKANQVPAGISIERQIE